jgi:tetratricopeptide (TPR) repeat protein
MRIYLRKAAHQVLPWLLSLFLLSAKEHRPQTAQINLQAGRQGCRAEVDSVPMGTTDSKGTLLIADVEPGDHYLHVVCSDGPDTAYFISPRADETTMIQMTKGSEGGARDPDSVRVAANRIQLNQLVPKAVQLRGEGKLVEATAALRQAIALDPENSDLHRELGITFLLDKDWKRARVEMIEAIRHDQSDADAHNGLGYALEKLGDLDGAIREYRTATHLDPDDPTYRTHYLDMLVKLSQRQEDKKQH